MCDIFIKYNSGTCGTILMRKVEHLFHVNTINMPNYLSIRLKYQIPFFAILDHIFGDQHFVQTLDKSRYECIS